MFSVNFDFTQFAATLLVANLAIDGVVALLKKSFLNREKHTTPVLVIRLLFVIALTYPGIFFAIGALGFIVGSSHKESLYITVFLLAFIMTLVRVVINLKETS